MTGTNSPLRNDEIASLPYGSVLSGFEGGAVGVKTSGLGGREFEVYYPDEERHFPLTINWTHDKLTRIA